jgi:uncharacterized protein (DUF1778 family)
MRAQVSKTRRTVKTLEDRHSFVLDKNRWDEFLKVLGRPPRIKRNLARLLGERSVFEGARPLSVVSRKCL